MGLLLNRAKASTSTTGTGTVTLGAAVAPYQSWSGANAVNNMRYSYLIEDGAAWEIGTGVYASGGGTLTRPGPGSDPTFMSSTGALLNLTGAATVACVENVQNNVETLIEELSPSGVGTVTFSNIPQVFRDLRLVVRGRSSQAAAIVTSQFRANADTGANYYRQTIRGINATASAAATAATTAGEIGNIVGTSATANIPSTVDVTFYDYRGTTFYKAFNGLVMRAQGLTTATQAAEQYAGFWASTAAITALEVYMSAGNYVAGTVISLYGRY